MCINQLIFYRYSYHYYCSYSYLLIHIVLLSLQHIFVFGYEVTLHN
eukprot:gene9054-6352_t